MSAPTRLAHERIRSVAAWTAATIAIIAGVLVPQLFLLAVVAVLGVRLVVLHVQRDEAIADWGAEVFKVAVWKAKAKSLEREAEQLHLLLTEADIAAARTVRVPLLRSVSKPRDKMDDDWLELLVTRPIDGAN